MTDTNYNRMLIITTAPRCAVYPVTQDEAIRVQTTWSDYTEGYGEDETVNIQYDKGNAVFRLQAIDVIDIREMDEIKQAVCNRPTLYKEDNVVTLNQPV